MYVDLVDSRNYLLVNTSLIKVLGLTGAVYCSELFTIIKRAASKKKVVDNYYVTVDRDYVANTLGISAEEQIQLENNWEKADFLERHKTKPDTFALNVKHLMMLISNQEEFTDEELSELKKKLQLKTAESKKEAKKQAIINGLKKSLVITDMELKAKVEEWIDTICSVNLGKALTKNNVQTFIDTLDKYTSDAEVAKEVVQVAINNAWRDCSWAINSYEKSKGTGPRKTTQRKATRENIDTEEAF